MHIASLDPSGGCSPSEDGTLLSRPDGATPPKDARSGFGSRKCSEQLFNNHVSALLEEQRHIDAECVRGLEIDNQFEFRGLLHWHIYRFTALQNFMHKKGAATKQGGAVRAV